MKNCCVLNVLRELPGGEGSEAIEIRSNAE